ncbi:MAG: alanine:cation symporter family protein [Clostridia bacterium]|nr:alanine:cation symporter family protein [Clostridia bacterium]
MDKVAAVNDVINTFVWVKIGIILLLGAGIVMTVCTRFFQVSFIGHWFRQTLGSLLKKDSDATKKTDKKSISAFQSLCTALAATVGTGNIAGVSAAIVIGGPGAVLWMWVAAFFGMMTKYSEIVLGMFYRRKNADGEWSGGSMYFLRDGLGKKRGMKTVSAVLAVLFALFAILASFGIGNMGQVNKITLNLTAAFFKNTEAELWGVPVVNLVIGAVLMVLTALIVIGGLQRIASFAEKVVPVMAILYIIGGLVIVGMNISAVGDVFVSIFKFAFGIKAVAGGAAGVAIAQIITQGCKRGMFSNEAGLGSSVMVHASANTKEPVKQGMWGIFEVFFDTIVVCTMTALVVLCSGFIDLSTGLPAVANLNDATLVSRIFGQAFGFVGEAFIAVAMLLFAFTTVVGWSQYGTKAVEYLFGATGVKVYKVVFVLMIMSGAVMTSSLAWDISDTFNGLMMIPNLIGVVALCPLVAKLTKNYIDRCIKGKDVEPMLSYNADNK